MKSIQQKVAKFNEKAGYTMDLEHRLLDLSSEVGELAKEVSKLSSYGRKERVAITDSLKEELGDSFYSLVSLANELTLDLEDCLNSVLEKYKLRLNH